MFFAKKCRCFHKKRNFVPMNQKTEKTAEQTMKRLFSRFLPAPPGTAVSIDQMMQVEKSVSASCTSKSFFSEIRRLKSSRV